MSDFPSTLYSREDNVGNKQIDSLDGIINPCEYPQYFLSVNTIDSSLETFYRTDGLLMWGEEE